MSCCRVIHFTPPGFSASFTYIVALVTNVHNYESSNRGTVVSIVEAAFSAGPSLLSLMYGVVFMHGELEHPGQTYRSFLGKKIIIVNTPKNRL